jgi:DNA-binding SARP family transcriptional activator
LASLLEGCGRTLHGDDAAPAFELATKAFNDLGAEAMVALVGQLRGEGSTTAVATSTTSEPTTSEPATLSLRCFDTLEIEVGSTPVDLSGVRPRALSVLRLLAFNAGRPVHREVLMESLWPDVEPDAALHSLQVAVSSLRKVLPAGSPGGIARQGDTYQLEISPDAFFDVRAFRSLVSAAATALAQGDLRRAVDDARRAVDLYRGDLLLDEGPAEWVVADRDVLRQEVVRACAVAAEAAIKLGVPGDAARFCERGLAVDRYADALWRLQIDALESASDKASAERVRRSWQEMMEDLGVA